jgi:hypothetical protein
MAREPPFPVPLGKSGPWEEVAGPEVSDGDVRQWPGKPLYRPVPETHYLISLATAWVKDQNLGQPSELCSLVPGFSRFELHFLFLSLSTTQRWPSLSAPSYPDSFATCRLIHFRRCQLLPRQVTRWLCTVRDGASGRGGPGLQEALWPSDGQILRLGETIRGPFHMADESHGRGL